MSAALPGTRPHVSVLLDETVDALAIQPGSRIVERDGQVLVFGTRDDPGNFPKLGLHSRATGVCGHGVAIEVRKSR